MCIIHLQPLHLHQCRDSRSLIEKNTVRDSYSRGIVIQGTDNTTISENVAYRTRGNTFVLVDGTETDNLFYKNLGALTLGTGDWWWHGNRVTGSHDQDDRWPATFFTRTPDNKWVGNVAAGSRRAGFYLVLHWRVNYESYASGMRGRPRNFGLGQFEGNVIHSNYDYGMEIRDFEPAKDRATGQSTGDWSGAFYNTDVYKNRYMGLKVEYNRDVMFDGGTFVDNSISIYTHRNNGIALRNLKIRGESDEFNGVASSQNAERFCHDQYSNDPKDQRPMGIYWMSYNRWDHGRRNELTGLDIAGFGDETNPGCTGGTGLFIRSQNGGSINEGGSPHFAFKTTLGDHTTIAGDVKTNIGSNRRLVAANSDASMINACYGQDRLGVDDILMDIEDGASVNGIFGPGVVISNTPKMMNMVQAFSPEIACTEYAESCVAVCAQTCLRQVEFRVEKESSKDMQMVITNNADNSTIAVDGMIYLGGDQLYRGRSRYFYAALPEGDFTVSFVDGNGDVGYPMYVIEKWEDAPTCAGHANPGDVTIDEGPEPAVGWDAYCSELIRNGDAESGSLEPWNHNGNGKVELVASGGVDGSSAVQLKSRSRDWGGFGMYLDQRCVKRSLGKTYEIKGEIRLFEKSDGVTPRSCNPNDSWSGTGCPEILFEKYYRRGSYKESMDRIDETSWSSYYPFAEMVRDVDPSGFSTIHGIMTFTHDHLDSESTFLSIRNVNSNANIVIDNLSMKPYGAFDSTDPSACDDLTSNGGLERGDAMFWDTFGSEKQMVLVEGAGGSGDLAIKMVGRDRTHHSPMQTLKRGCMKPGDRYVAEVKFKMTDRDTGATVACVPQTEDSNRYTDEERAITCPEIRAHHEGNGVWGYMTMGNVVVPARSEGWNVAKGAFYALDNQINAHRLRAWLEDEPTRYDITMDDFHIRPVPMSEACSNLVLNPTFDGDLSFWSESKVALYLCLF